MIDFELAQQKAQNDRKNLCTLFEHPNYMKFSHSKAGGIKGHATAYFIRPILQGTYYAQIKILDDCTHEEPTQYPSSVRIGLCNSDYNIEMPLGQQNSICINSKGNLITQAQSIPYVQPWQVGDVIGVKMDIGSPYKHPSPKERHQYSSIQYYRNGKQICELKQLRQQFYSFGFSLYNYAQIWISIDTKDFFYPIEQIRQQNEIRKRCYGLRTLLYIPIIYHFDSDTVMMFNKCFEKMDKYTLDSN